MIVLPGGQPGTDNLDNDIRIKELVAKMARDDQFVAAICAAPKVLANAGVLKGKRATSFPGVLEKMQLRDVTLETASVVRDGRIITSRGPGTAMDFALELIELLSGKDKRVEIEKSLQRPG
jgi:4-methyl-5(b-hydroxyethyl)-thiazole monophosphate biosynthesis